MNEDEKYIFDLPAEKLEFVPHDVLKWQCSAEGCNRYTRIKDFGISPYYRDKSKWTDLSCTILLCSKHWPIYKKSPNLIVYKQGSGIDHLKENV